MGKYPNAIGTEVKSPRENVDPVSSIVPVDPASSIVPVELPVDLAVDLAVDLPANPSANLSPKIPHHCRHTADAPPMHSGNHAQK